MATMKSQKVATVNEAGPAFTDSRHGRLSDASDISLVAALQHAPESATSSAAPGRPQEQMQIETPVSSEDDIEWPTGAQLWLNMIAIMIVCFLHGLDLTIVAVAVPSLTDQFKTVADIGWYSAVYGLVMSATCFFFGKVYTVFDLKKTYIVSVGIFELGSLLCTFAPNSKAFIIGRALAGLDSSGQGAGAMVCIPRFFPNHKRPIVVGVIGFAQCLGLVSAPIIGGALTDAFTWRACFGINIPIGIVAMAIAAIGMKDPFPNPDIQLPFGEKLKRLDMTGTLLVIPSIVCLLLGLQWGGNRYGWSDWRIIVLFVLFAILVVAFGYVQHRLGDKAVLPLHILKNRTILAGSLFCCCLNGALAVTEYYIAVYFQGVRGYSATSAGLLGLPMVAGLAVSSSSAAFGVTWVGYYSPFMYATGILGPIAAGVLTTIDLDDSNVKVAALLGFLGFAFGLGIQAPTTAAMTVMSPKDVSVGLAIVRFAAGLGSSLCVAASAAIFHDRLKVDIAKSAPNFNSTLIDDHGLGDLRKAMGSDHLKDVLFGYNEAVIQTLYVPLALSLLAILGAVFTEVRSVKKKRE